MSLVLCKDEKILKNWTFANGDTSSGTLNYNLTVTDKRIISTASAEHFIERTEIPLNSVKGIKGKYSAEQQTQGAPLRALVVLGILLAMTGVLLICFLHGEAVMAILGVVIIIAGLAMAIYGGSRSTVILANAGFELIITTYGNESVSMTVGNRKEQSISISRKVINETAAMEIIDTIGALITEKRVADGEGLSDEYETPALSKG